MNRARKRLGRAAVPSEWAVGDTLRSDTDNLGLVRGATYEVLRVIRTSHGTGMRRLRSRRDATGVTLYEIRRADGAGPAFRISATPHLSKI